MNQSEAKTLCLQMINGDLQEQEIVNHLESLCTRGESAEEIAGFSEAIIGNAVKIPFDGPTVDMCGTGGSGLERFNVSTCAAFVISCFDLKVAKHGNKGSKRPNGSFDLLEVLDVPFDQNPEQQAEALEKMNLSFIFARKAHPAMANVAGARKKLARRTIFNMAGPLSNPTRVREQVIGVSAAEVAEKMLEAASLLGKERVSVVMGEPGIDELSVSGQSRIIRTAQGKRETLEVHPAQFGIAPVDYSELPKGDALTNAEIFNDLLENKTHRGIKQMVALNAGLVLWNSQLTSSLEDGMNQALSVIESGDLKRKYSDYKSFAKKQANLN